MISLDVFFRTSGGKLMTTIISAFLNLLGFKKLSRFFQQMAIWEFEGAICDLVALLSPRQISKLNRGEDVIVTLENRRMIGLLENLEQRPFVELALEIVGSAFGLKLDTFKTIAPNSKMAEARHLLLIVMEQDADEQDFEPPVTITRNHFDSNKPRKIEEAKPKAMAAKAGGK